MIILTHERGLISNPLSWDEIESLPGYARGIDPSQHKLKAIIGSYHLKDIHCGLLCNQPHDKGYIVQTQNGTVTNLGNRCGKNHFGVDFDTFKNQHHRELTARNNRDLIYTFSFQVEDLETKLNSLKKIEFGIDWIYKTSQELINKGGDCPDSIVKEVNSMVKSGSNTLEKEREATEKEIDELEVVQHKKVQRPYYVRDEIAKISGLELLNIENDLRRLVTLDLLEKIKPFKLLDIESLSYSELLHWAKWINSIENTNEKIRLAVNAGINLLNSSNLKPFLEIIKNGKDLKQFNKFLAKLPVSKQKIEYEF